MTTKGWVITMIILIVIGNLIKTYSLTQNPKTYER